MGLKKLAVLGVLLIALSGISIHWLNSHHAGKETSLEEELAAFTQYITINDHIGTPIFYTETEGISPNLAFAGEIKERVRLTFPKEDPLQGDFAAMELPLTNLVEGQAYTVRMSLHDSYHGDPYPNLFHQYVLLGDEVIWQHDMTGEDFTGWNGLEYSFVASTPQTQLTIGVQAMGEIPEGWSWGTIAGVEVQHIYIGPSRDQL
ncbi:hypothetical protein [Natronincola ferrireducens]|uniref:Uncharacterized protein n=1 Tax=Natronincola ferrireducens TaxID=393762 RepID=A0A1G8X2W5_9FIRM|nr:hypothetical protein [Natronincola ferrireducens]SDJ84863.1 hypothetical protein SAMN05660472_00101 [Natronincola ferrireducens]